MLRALLQARYRRILWFFGRAILSVIAWDILLPRLGLRALSRRTRAERLRRTAVRFRGLAIQMGGVMIKVGQFLSARLDVLPREIIDELSDLQDEVRPEAFEDIRQVLEAEMKLPVEQAFTWFDPQVLASASIGQVHRARLRVGSGMRIHSAQGNDSPAGPSLETLDQVVVKVQRPNIPFIVETDLAALRVVSRWLSYYPPIRKRSNAPALMEEFSRSLNEETDYLLEGKNAETFAANFANQPGVYVPNVIWSHTTRRVLTLEEILAIKITDYERIEAAGISRSKIAEQLFDTYLKQIFEDRFFHADPHPGNLFVRPQGEAGAFQIIFVDFGMTGMISPNQFTALREILISFGTRDVPRLIRGYQTMGLLLPNADLALLEKATQRAFEHFWGKSTSEIVSLGQQEALAFAHEFRELLYEMPFQVPENLILLGRCVSILSGICTGLDPDFNVWVSIMPYASRLVQADQGGRNVWLGETVNILQTLVSLPGRADSLLQRIEQGRLEVQMPEMRVQMARLERRINRLAGAIVFAALFGGATQLYLAGQITIAAVCAGIGLLTFFWLSIER